jgi:hypothetical protein
MKIPISHRILNLKLAKQKSPMAVNYFWLADFQFLTDFKFIIR